MSADAAASRPVVGAMTAVLVASVGVRLATLWRLPPYFDESFYALQGHAVATDRTALFVALSDGKGPLLNWLTAIPILLGAEPLVAVRLVAGLASAGTAVLVYVLGRRVCDRTTAAAGMAIYALLPFVILQGSMGFHEPLVAFFATAALVLEVQLARDPSWGCALLLGGALGAGLLTKPTGQIVLVLLPASFPLLLPLGGPGAGRRLRRWMGAVAVALVVTALLYAIMMTSPLFYAQPSEGQYTPLGFALAHADRGFRLNWPDYRVELATYLTAPFVLLLGLGLGYGLAERPRTTVFLTVWVAGGFVASTIVSNKPLARYQLPWLAPLALFIADGLLLVLGALGRSRWVPDRARMPVLAGAVALLALPALAWDLSFLLHPETLVLPAFDDREFVADWPAGTELARLARQIVRRAGDGGGAIAFSPRNTVNRAWSILLDDPAQSRHPLVDVWDARAKGARFLIEIGFPLVQPLPCIPTGEPGCDRVDASRYRLIDAVERPRFGASMRLFERAE